MHHNPNLLIEHDLLISISVSQNDLLYAEIEFLRKRVSKFIKKKVSFLFNKFVAIWLYDNIDSRRLSYTTTTSVFEQRWVRQEKYNNLQTASYICLNMFEYIYM